MRRAAVEPTSQMPSDEFSTQQSNRSLILDEGQRQAVHAQLERILASSWFTGSTRMSGFFRFIVENTLAAKADDLKETVIGVDVFGKDAGYSPREDPVVRVMAGRLRSKLA